MDVEAASEAASGALSAVEDSHAALDANPKPLQPTEGSKAIDANPPPSPKESVRKRLTQLEENEDEDEDKWRDGRDGDEEEGYSMSAFRQHRENRARSNHCDR